MLRAGAFNFALKWRLAGLTEITSFSNVNIIHVFVDSYLPSLFNYNDNIILSIYHSNMILLNSKLYVVFFS